MSISEQIQLNEIEAHAKSILNLVAQDNDEDFESELDRYYEAIKTFRPEFFDNLYMAESKIYEQICEEISLEDEDRSVSDAVEVINLAIFSYNMYVQEELKECAENFFQYVAPFDKLENEDITAAISARKALLGKLAGSTQASAHHYFSKVFPENINNYGLLEKQQSKEVEKLVYAKRQEMVLKFRKSSFDLFNSLQPKIIKAELKAYVKFRLDKVNREMDDNVSDDAYSTADELEIQDLVTVVELENDDSSVIVSAFETEHLDELESSEDEDQPRKRRKMQDSPVPSAEGSTFLDDLVQNDTNNPISEDEFQGDRKSPEDDDREPDNRSTTASESPNQRRGQTPEVRETVPRYFNAKLGKRIKVPKVRAQSNRWTVAQTDLLEKGLNFYKHRAWAAIVNKYPDIGHTNTQCKDKAVTEVKRRKAAGIPLGGFQYYLHPEQNYSGSL